MPKMKTKRAASKRFKSTGSGKIRGTVAYKQHNTSKRTPKMKRQARGMMTLREGDAGIVRRFLPYGASRSGTTR